MWRVGLGKRWGKGEESCKGLWEAVLHFFQHSLGWHLSLSSRQETPPSSLDIHSQGTLEAKKDTPVSL